jgi:hypothetical protein
MHSHGNPNRHLGENPRRIAALQFGAGSSDDFTGWASGGIAQLVLYLICS